MNDDDVFRVALVVVMATFLPAAACCRIRSNATREKLDRWQEGAFILFGLRLGSIPMFAGVLAWLINPAWMAWSAISLPAWVRSCGIALMFIWGALLVWTFQSLGNNLTDTVVTRKAHTLVTTGPYRYVRHPFYLTILVAVVGAALAMANWFFLLAGAVPLAFLFVRTRIEEEKLVERFGDDYREYMRRVGRFVPRLTGHRPLP